MSSRSDAADAHENDAGVCCLHKTVRRTVCRFGSVRYENCFYAALFASAAPTRPGFSVSDGISRRPIRAAAVGAMVALALRLSCFLQSPHIPSGTARAEAPALSG